MSSLTLILGPMKSGKTSDLGVRIRPYVFTKQTPLGTFQSELNVRDAESQLSARSGITISAVKIASLWEILNFADNLHYIAIDEVHMFQEQDALAIEKLLLMDKEIFCSGLNLDYKRDIFPIIRELYRLGPSKISMRRAVCEKCDKYEAVFTQVYAGDVAITSGYPSIIPEGAIKNLNYSPVCRFCGITESVNLSSVNNKYFLSPQLSS